MKLRNGKPPAREHTLDASVADCVCSICGALFSLGVPIIGEPSERRVQRFSNELSSHMIQTHPERAKEIAHQIQLAAAQLVMFLAFSGFGCSNPDIIKVLDEARRAVKRLVFGPVPTDEDLRRLAGADDPNVIWSNVTEALQKLRDALTETPVSFRDPPIPGMDTAQPV